MRRDLKFWDEIKHMGGQIKPEVRSKWKYTKFWSNYSNWSFWDEISHLGGQIKHWVRSICEFYIIFIQISLTPGQVAKDVSQALEHMYLESPCTHAPKNSDPSLLGTVIRRHLVMVHTVHSVLLSIFRARGPPDSMLSSCDPPFWCHGFLIHGDI